MKTITQAAIMRTALEKYMGSEDQWCTWALARDKHGVAVSAVSPQATTHCAEGAVIAAALHLRDGMVHRRKNLDETYITPVLQGVEKILVQQHPEFVEQVLRVDAGARPDNFTDGRSLPAFNDGVMVSTHMDGIPGVGYQGIRAAFEKYLTECEEKGL